METNYIFERPLTPEASTEFLGKGAEYSNLYSGRLLAVIQHDEATDYQTGAHVQIDNPIDYAYKNYKKSLFSYARFDKFKDGSEVLIEDIHCDWKYNYILDTLGVLDYIAKYSETPISIIFPTNMDLKSIAADHNYLNEFTIRIRRILMMHPHIKILIQNSNFVKSHDGEYFSLSGSTPGDSYVVAKYLRYATESDRIGYCVDMSEYYAAEAFIKYIRPITGTERFPILSFKEFLMNVYNDDMLQLIIAGCNQGNEQTVNDKGFGFSNNEETKSKAEELAWLYNQFSLDKKCPIVIKGKTVDEENASAGIFSEILKNQGDLE